MGKAIYSKTLGISTDDIAACDNPFQLKKWALAVQRDCLAIKEGIEYLKDDDSQRGALLKRKAALRSQIQMLREIESRYKEAKIGILPIMNEIVAFYHAANKTLPRDVIDEINTQAMKDMKISIQ